MSTVNEIFWLSVLAGTLRAAVPLILAGLGQIVYERSGVLNLGIEGFLLLGALSAVAAQASGAPWLLSLGFAAVVCAFATLLHSTICVFARTNQAVTGLAILFFLQGVTALWGRNLVGIPLSGLHQLTFSQWAEVPLWGSLLSSVDYLVPIVFMAAFLLAFMLKRSTYGIWLRACGENSQAARNAGLRPHFIRLWAGFWGGIFFGIAGGYLALFTAQQWQENMVGGRGWMALVLVIFARWQPVRLLFAALLFGGLTALQLNLQITGVSTSRYLLAAAPFLITILVLAISSFSARRGQRAAPAELGKALEGF